MAVKSPAGFMQYLKDSIRLELEDVRRAGFDLRERNRSMRFGKGTYLCVFGSFAKDGTVKYTWTLADVTIPEEDIRKILHLVNPEQLPYEPAA